MLPFMQAESCLIKKLGSDVGVKITPPFWGVHCGTDPIREPQQITQRAVAE
jgi:hypothetical protein